MGRPRKYSQKEIRAAFLEWSLEIEKEPEKFMSGEKRDELSHTEFADLTTETLLEYMDSKRDGKLVKK